MLDASTDGWSGATAEHVLVIDPSLFTLPYDEALVAALAGAGAAPLLVGRPRRAGEAPPRVPFRAHFHRLLDAAPRRFGPFGAALKAQEYLANAASLVRRAARGTVFHVQWLPFPLADAAVLAAARRRGPVVVTVHDTEPFNGAPTARLQRLGFAAALARAHRLIVHTAAGRARLEAMGLPEQGIRVVPHGPLGGGEGARPPRNERWTVVAFGKMRPYKGVDTLVAAVARLEPAVRRRPRVVIAGEPLMDLGPLARRIDASRLGGCVELLPRRFSEAEMDALFAGAGAFVFPYREIEASGVLYRVQGYRRWLIAARLGAFAEAIDDGDSGRLVAPEDVDALAAALVEGATRRPVPTTAVRVVDWATIARATRATYAEARGAWLAEQRPTREVTRA
jgi:glycosyltransferase involved in cell wall biosynthesis